jgi:hypothetical protein
MTRTVRAAQVLSIAQIPDSSSEISGIVYNQQTLTYASSVEADTSSYTSFVLTVTGNVTINASGMVAGKTCTFIIIGDATGGWTVSFGNGFSNVENLIVSASTAYTLSFCSNGSSLFEVSRAPQSPVYIWR